jgi:hypothetical protein
VAWWVPVVEARFTCVEYLRVYIVVKPIFEKKYIMVIEDEHSRLELWIPHMDAKESLSLSMHKSFHITVGSGVLQDPSYSYIVRLLDLEEYT